VSSDGVEEVEDRTSQKPDWPTSQEMPPSMHAPIQQQLALDIFKSLGKAKKVFESPREIGFNKANTFIDATDVSLVGRRVINAVLFLAAREPDASRWEVDLDHFKWLIAYNSKNDGPLKRAFREGQKSAVQASIIELDANGKPLKEKWAAVPLLGTVILNGGHLTFTIPDEIRKQLRDPRSFTFLSLRISTALSSIYSIVMYEKLSREKFRGRTEMIPLDEFKKWFGTTDKAYLNEYKYLRRRVIDPAIDDINKLSDIRVTMEPRCQGGGKRVTHLIFRVEENPDGKYALANLVKLSKEQQNLLETIQKEFGISKNFMSEITSRRDEWTDDYIKAAITLTRYRMQRKAAKGEDVSSPGGYFMQALRGGWVLSDQELKQMTAAEQKTIKQAETQKAILDAKNKVDEQTRVTNRILLSEYENLPLDAQNKVFSAFKASGTYKLIAKKDMGFNAQTVLDDNFARNVFVGFLATQERVIFELQKDIDSDDDES
jgi:hypothetical protein